MDEARRMGSNFAKLPALLGRRSAAASADTLLHHQAASGLQMMAILCLAISRVI